MALESAPIKGTVYLNMSLFCQAVLNELWEIERGEASRGRKPTALERAIRSLRKSPAVEEEERVFQSYEEMRVLAQVLSKHPNIRSARRLADLLDMVKRRRGQHAKAIDFFAELSREASARVRFPEEEMPERVRRFVTTGSATK